MRKEIKDFVQIVSSLLPLPEPIVEFGSFIVPEQSTLANLRPLFPNKQYFGADMRLGPGVELQTNLHDPGIRPGSIGTILCLDTLEHVEYPHQALENMKKLLKPDGMVVISSVMRFPIHEYPSDYWRFTPFGFQSLLKPFATSFVESAGGDDSLPETIVGIGFVGARPEFHRFAREVYSWKARQCRPLEKWIRALMPPLLLHMIGRWFKKR